MKFAEIQSDSGNKSDGNECSNNAINVVENE